MTAEDDPFDMLNIMQTGLDIQRERDLLMHGGEEGLKAACEARNAQLIAQLPKDYPRIEGKDPAVAELATAIKYDGEQRIKGVEREVGPEITESIRKTLMAESSEMVRTFALVDFSHHTAPEKLYREAQILASLSTQKDIARYEVANELATFQGDEILRRERLRDVQTAKGK